MVCSYDVLYSNSKQKKKATATCNSADKSHRNNTEQEKSDMKEYILYDSTHMKFKNKQN